MPNLQRGGPTERDAPHFSARAAALRLHGMNIESLSRREAESVPAAHSSRTATKGKFRVIDQIDLTVRGLSGDPARTTARRPIRESLKRTFDVSGAILLGLIFSPLIVVIAVVLRREGGPVIFRHRRIGRDGKAFDCLKFRSMVPDADRVLRDLLQQHSELKAEWLRDHKLRNDPRITAAGRFLRRTSLDELPQLWNVIRGEMSLVGPRPVVREELLRYGRCACIYLSARPGVTGLWQVTGRNNTDYRRRVAMDVYYVRRQNLFLDLYILLKTTHVVLGGRGAY